MTISVTALDPAAPVLYAQSKVCAECSGLPVAFLRAKISVSEKRLSVHAIITSKFSMQTVASPENPASAEICLRGVHVLPPSVENRDSTSQFVAISESSCQVKKANAPSMAIFGFNDSLGVFVSRMSGDQVSPLSTDRRPKISALPSRRSDHTMMMVLPEDTTDGKLDLNGLLVRRRSGSQVWPLSVERL